MSVDRRRILRTTAQLAAMTAAGGLLPGCDKEAAKDREAAKAAGAAKRQPSGPPGGDPAMPRYLTPDELSSSPPVLPTDTPAPTSAPPSTPAATHAPTEPPSLAAGTPVEVVNGPRDRPQFALTFHGQGDPSLARAVLDVAEERGARVTVLVVGTWLDQQPQMAQRILEGGHELGNHTLNHLDISSMSADRAYAEIAGCADRLHALTGSIGRWFRPSAAQYATSRVMDQAYRVGYDHCLSYDVDPRDYTDPGAEVVERRLLASVRAGSIVALHMGHRGTLEALPAVLDTLEQHGLTAVTASQLCS